MTATPTTMTTVPPGGPVAVKVPVAVAVAPKNTLGRVFCVHIWLAPEGLDKFSKAASSILSLIRLRNVSMPVFTELMKHFNEVAGFIGPAGACERLFTFIRGTNDEGKALTIWKRINAGCLAVSKTAETLAWMSIRGMVELGRLAKAIGGTPLFNITRKFTAFAVKNKFTIIACCLAIVDASIEISQGKGLTKQVLTLVNESGKVYTTLFCASWFTMSFAVIAVITGVSGLAKFIYSEYHKPPMMS